MVVIGGGILGCMTARNLRRWNISVLLLEQEDDVCKGITKANSAIVYAGYDNKPGTNKAEFTVRGNANMEKLCGELNVPFSRCGSLLVTYEEASVPRLRKKLEQGRANGVPGLKFLSGSEAEEMEPMLRPGVAAALYAPSTGTVNPWQLGIAAYENALQNGAQASLNTSVLSIEETTYGYRIHTERQSYECKMVVNCAGLFADRVQEMVYAPHIRLELDGAEYLVFDRNAAKPNRVIFHQAKRCGKGITAIPCVEGNLLISGARKDLYKPFETTYDGLLELREAVQDLMPDVDTSQVIRSFGAVRPNPHLESGENLHDFCVDRPAPNFLSMIGIKTPGLTASNELGYFVARECAKWLEAEGNSEFDPVRKSFRSPQPGDTQIICQCEGITKGQVLDAVSRGAATVDAVKRRVGTGMGACQGARCGWRIAQILKATKVNPNPMI